MANEQLTGDIEKVVAKSAEPQEKLADVQDQVHRTRENIKSTEEGQPEIDGKAMASIVSGALRNNADLIAALNNVGLGADETLREIENLVISRAALLNEQNTPENVREVRRVTEILGSMFKRFYDLYRKEDSKFFERTKQRGLSEGSSQDTLDKIYSDPLEQEAIKTRRALEWLSNLFELAKAQIMAEKDINPSTFFRGGDPNNNHKLSWREDNKPDKAILDDVFKKVLDRLKDVGDVAEINPELMREILELLDTELQSANYPTSQYSELGSVLSGKKLELGRVIPLVSPTKPE